LHRMHFTAGSEIRNALGLWTGNRELLDDVGTDHPDDAAAVIIHALWKRSCKPMNEDRQPVTVDELALSTMIEQEALVRLLVDKGLITREELLQKVAAVRDEMARKREEN